MRHLALLCVLGAVLAVPATAGAALTAGLTAAPSPAAPLTVDFAASGSAADPGRTIVAFSWDFGDGTSGAGPQVSHAYAGAGVFLVTLTVTDDAGVVTAASASVTVQAVRLDLAETSVVWGGQIAASGLVEPVSAGLEVVVELGSGGEWVPLGRAATDSAGRFALLVAPQRGGVLRVRVAESGAVGAAAPVSVAPKVVLRPLRDGVAFVGAKLVARIYPAEYAGRVAVTVRRNGESVANAAARVRDGRLAIRVPTPGIGRFNVLLELRPDAGLAPRRLVVQVRSRAPRDLGPGARGAAVIGLARRLGVLGYHLPGTRALLGASLRDVVVAFQRVAGLRPTGSVAEPDWRALARARPLEARYERPALHFEVDVRRGILLVVRDGRVTGVLPVAADEREITARGAFLLRTRSPLATTWPGLVEVPRWAAGWLYHQSRAGVRVYIYS